MEDICLWLLNFAGSVPQVLQIILISDGLLKKAPVPIEGEERQEFSSKKMLWMVAWCSLIHDFNV